MVILNKDTITLNSLIVGKCKKVLSDIKDDSVDLVYADIPFYTGKIQEAPTGHFKEVEAYDDRYKEGLIGYLDDMRENLKEIHRVLKHTGTFYLHCDYHAGHYLKVECDNRFGYNNFRNEIIWFYDDTPGRPSKDFARKHDTIFRYTKSNDYIFNADDVRLPIKEESKQRYMYERELGGKKYLGGSSEIKGKIAEDVWLIPAVKGNSKEYVNYPTQKPLLIPERIIKASTNKGAVVLDPFCGSGTTLVAAELLNRKWIGSDLSPSAIKLSQQRLINQANVGLNNINVIGMPKTINDLKELTWFNFQRYVVVDLMDAKMPKNLVRDGNIDGWTKNAEPIQVKQSEKVGVAEIERFMTTLTNAKKTRGYMVAFSFAHTSYKAAEDFKIDYGRDINLLRIDQLLKGEYRPPRRKEFIDMETFIAPDGTEYLKDFVENDQSSLFDFMPE